MPSSSSEQTLALAYLCNTLSKEEGKKLKIKLKYMDIDWGAIYT